MSIETGKGQYRAEDSETEFEMEMRKALAAFTESAEQIGKDFDVRLGEQMEKMGSLRQKHKHIEKAIDTLGLLQQELIRDFFDCLQRLSVQRNEIKDLTVTQEEIEREFQKNPTVTVNLKSFGLESILVPNMSEQEIQEKLLVSAFSQIMLRAELNKPQNVAFDEEIVQIQKKLSEGLSDIMSSTKFNIDTDDLDNSEQIVETKLKQYAIASRQVLDECLKDTRELFFNR